MCFISKILLICWLFSTGTTLELRCPEGFRVHGSATIVLQDLTRPIIDSDKFMVCIICRITAEVFKTIEVCQQYGVFDHFLEEESLGNYWTKNTELPVYTNIALNEYVFQGTFHLCSRNNIEDAIAKGEY